MFESDSYKQFTKSSAVLSHLLKQPDFVYYKFAELTIVNMIDFVFGIIAKAFAILCLVTLVMVCYSIFKSIWKASKDL